MAVSTGVMRCMALQLFSKGMRQLEVCLPTIRSPYRAEVTDTFSWADSVGRLT